MWIEINGEERELPHGLSVAEMLAALGLDPAKVAIERNRRIVARSTFEEAVLISGDRVEIVQFVGGG